MQVALGEHPTRKFGGYANVGMNGKQIQIPELVEGEDALLVLVELPH